MLSSERGHRRETLSGYPQIAHHSFEPGTEGWRKTCEELHASFGLSLRVKQGVGQALTNQDQELGTQDILILHPQYHLCVREKDNKRCCSSHSYTRTSTDMTRWLCYVQVFTSFHDFIPCMHLITWPDEFLTNIKRWYLLRSMRVLYLPENVIQAQNFIWKKINV